MPFHRSTLLIALLKSITDGRLDGKPFRFRQRESPKNEFECMDNISQALDYITRKGIRLVNIGPGDIYHGNMKITLGLIWTLIQAFQIDAKEGVGVEASSSSSSQSSSSSIPQPVIDVAAASRHDAAASSGSQLLLRWCQGVTVPYDSLGVNVRDFAGSFSDGVAFAALIHAHKPDIMDLELLTGDPKINLTRVMQIAAQHLGVPPMLDAEDIDLMATNPKSLTKVVQL